MCKDGGRTCGSQKPCDFLDLSLRRDFQVMRKYNAQVRTLLCTKHHPTKTLSHAGHSRNPRLLHENHHPFSLPSLHLHSLRQAWVSRSVQATAGYFSRSRGSANFVPVTFFSRKKQLKNFAPFFQYILKEYEEEWNLQPLKRLIKLSRVRCIVAFVVCIWGCIAFLKAVKFWSTFDAFLILLLPPIERVMQVTDDHDKIADVVTKWHRIW